MLMLENIKLAWSLTAVACCLGLVGLFFTPQSKRRFVTAGMVTTLLMATFYSLWLWSGWLITRYPPLESLILVWTFFPAIGLVMIVAVGEMMIGRR